MHGAAHHSSTTHICTEEPDVRITPIVAVVEEHKACGGAWREGSGTGPSTLDTQESGMEVNFQQKATESNAGVDLPPFHSSLVSESMTSSLPSVRSGDVGSTSETKCLSNEVMHESLMTHTCLQGSQVSVTAQAAVAAAVLSLEHKSLEAGSSQEICGTRQVSESAYKSTVEGNLRPEATHMLQSGVLPVLGPAGVEFDKLAAARLCLSTMSTRGKTQTCGCQPVHRRLLWLCWLGVLNGKSPHDWVAEIKSYREKFVQLLTAAAPTRLTSDP